MEISNPYIGICIGSELLLPCIMSNFVILLSLEYNLIITNDDIPNPPAASHLFYKVIDLTLALLLARHKR